MAAAMKPLSPGKSYHFHVIYNHHKSGQLPTDDQNLSLKLVKFLAVNLSSAGYTQCYYHEKDSSPGRNVFKELCRVMNESDWTVVVLTDEFAANGWVQYCRDTTFKKLIDYRKEDSLIPIALGIHTLPEELGAKEGLYFDAEPEKWSERNVEKIIKVLDAGLSVNRVESNDPRQDHGDGRLRTDGCQPSLPDTSNTTQNLNKVRYDVAALCLSEAQPVLTAAVHTMPSEESSGRPVTNGKGYIMISYSWDDQEEVIQIRDSLKKDGYDVWMDIDNMTGSVVEAMAKAVEKAHIILMCMSQKYKESTYCKAEAEYAFSLKKKIIPLMMEKGFRPDGWLGMLLGAKLFFDFSGKYPFEEKIKELKREISNSYRDEDL